MTNTAPETRPPLADDNGVLVRPALEVLSRLRSGKVMDMLALEMNRVVSGVKDSQTGKGGTVTLTLKINPIKQKQNAVLVVATITGKAPEDPPESDLLFYDDDANLHTRNPMQSDIFDDGPRGV